MVSHKKKLRSEKAKVKLKATKLPKGLNVTKTEFKVRKITIREQLKETQFADGQRQLNIKETISRLKHHSSNARADALRKLREALIARSVNLTGYMHNVVQSISAISLDVDKDTRRDSFKVLKCLLTTLTTEEVLPFFHIISSYLRCAMTHIQPAIQEDSLLMLDVLIEHVPQLVVTQSAKIVRNFLEMISRARKEGDHTSRTLTVRLGQKQTTIKWRTKVLERLQQMLSTLVESERDKKNERNVNNFTKVVTFNPNVPQYYEIRRPYLNSAPEIDLLTLFRPSLNSNGAGAVEKTEEEKLREYVNHLLPLLIESWIEVRPQNQSTSITLTSEAALTLKVVLEILQNIWQLIKLHEQEKNHNLLSDWFREEYAEIFASSFLTEVFPYQQGCERDPESSKKSYKKHLQTLNSSGGQLCLQQNICIAYLICQFYKSHKTTQLEANKFVSLLNYLEEVVSNLKTHSLQDYHVLIQALRICLLENDIHVIQLHGNLANNLLNSTLEAFLENHFPAKYNSESEVLTLVCDIIRSWQLRQTYGDEIFKRFMLYLPQLLLRPNIQLSTLIAMSSLVKQKNAILLHELENKIELVIQNIQKIHVYGAVNAFEGKKHIMNLFYWTEKQYTPEYKNQLLQNIDEYISDKRIINYYKYILS
ncbi:PREDICTED: testis-expressed sequence 10 protein [Rhagoletis zephyria]|uniref:testis-expressed sequence 10 protein n=1 Tax=Rhagoletis zephyria TaxID=28612 RepID=UPI0008115EB2|nr:PREDICTED: testis-expressed sequence 10 protein [Rhagoletis zephyria]